MIVIIICYMRILITLLMLLIFPILANAEVIKAEISVNDVPKALLGTWRVDSKLDNTNAYDRFRPQGVDFWKLSLFDDKFTLDNPNTKVKAQVSLNTVEGNLIVFTKKTNYDNNKVLTDTVNIRLEGDKFSGINTLKLESFSLIDNHLMKTETAKYLLKGEKLSGDTIPLNK